MNNKVKVTIERNEEKITVKNDKGKSWSYYYQSPCNDGTIETVAADITSAMLTATINQHLRETKSKKLTYELTINTK